jgi:hypothetical protein
MESTDENESIFNDEEVLFRDDTIKSKELDEIHENGNSLQYFNQIKDKFIQKIKCHPDIYTFFEIPGLTKYINSFHTFQNDELFSVIEDMVIVCSDFEPTKCQCVSNKQLNLFRHCLLAVILDNKIIKHESCSKYDYQLATQCAYELFHNMKYQSNFFCDYCSNFRDFKIRLGYILKLFDGNFKDVSSLQKSNFESLYRFWCDFIIMKKHWYNVITETEKDMSYREITRYGCLKYQSSLTPEKIGTILTSKEHSEIKSDKSVHEGIYSIRCNTCQKPYPLNYVRHDICNYMHGDIYYYTKIPQCSQLEGLVYDFGYGSLFDSDMGQVLDKTLPCGKLCDACAVDLLEQGKLAVPTYNGL